METIIVKHGQTLIDIAIQYLGDASRYVEIIEINNLTITEDIHAGDELIIPTVANEKTAIVSLFDKKNIKPASAITGIISENEGVDYWRIEENFIVQ